VEISDLLTDIHTLLDLPTASISTIALKTITQDQGPLFVI
jgi:hypothetical protein